MKLFVKKFKLTVLGLSVQLLKVLQPTVHLNTVVIVHCSIISVNIPHLLLRHPTDGKYIPTAASSPRKATKQAALFGKSGTRPGPPRAEQTRRQTPNSTQE